MPTQQQIDEILEVIWMEREKGAKDLCVVEADLKTEKLQNFIRKMEQDG